MQVHLWKYRWVRGSANAQYPCYSLDAPRSREGLETCEQGTLDLPTGFSIVFCPDGKRRVQDPSGCVCEFVACLDHGFWLCPMTQGTGLGQYFRVLNNREAEGFVARIGDRP